MKYLIYLGLALVAVTHLNAQNSISGTVTDQQTHETLPGATIYFQDLQKFTSTDTNGYYHLDGLPRGTFTMEVRYLAYGNKVLKVTVNGKVTQNIQLSPAVTEIGEVVVTGTSASTERKLNPVPTIVIDQISSGSHASTNVIDALADQPGISQITTGAAISKPVIRGLGYNRVVVLYNNMRQEGQQWGDEHGIEIDQFAVDRAEVIKGPGSLRYGSDAMAGVINLLPPKPLEKGQIRGEIIGNYQTNNGLIGASAMNQGNIKGIQWLGRISTKQAGNYQNQYDGRVYNSGFNEVNANGSVGINKKWGYAKLYASSFNQQLGLVEGERDSLGRFIKLVAVNDTTVDEVAAAPEDLAGYTIHVPSQKINHLRLTSSNKFFINHSSLSVDLTFQQNRRREFGDPLQLEEPQLYFALNTFNYDVNYSLPDWKEWETSLGVNGMHQTSKNKGTEFLIPEYELLDAGAFAITQKNFDRWHISGGLRYDIRHINAQPLYLDANEQPVTDPNQGETKFEAFQTTLTNWSASLGASYSLSEQLILKGNFSRGYRAPNMAELGSNGIHEGTFRYEVGNHNLQAETSWQSDLGLLFNNEHISLELSVFHNDIQHYIYLTKLNGVNGQDSIIDPNEPVPAYQYTQGNANLYGGEVSLDIHPHPLDWLHFENSFGFVRGIQLDQPDSLHNLPFIPAPRLTSELRADIKPKTKWMQSLFVKVEVVSTFEQPYAFTAYGTETPTPGYMLVNAAIGAQIQNRNDHTICDISIVGSNLLDAAYQNHLSRLKYAPENLATGRAGVFNMGRNVSLQVRIPLNFKA